MRGQPLRAVVVGLGVMGTHHARVAAALDQVDLVGLIDPREDRRDAAARTHPNVPLYASLDDALASVEPELACLAGPVEHLPELARQAIEAGAAPLVEKPMAPTEPEALELIELAERHAVPLAVGHVERFNPAVIALKRKLDEGAAGRVYQIHARRLSPLPLRESMLGVSLDLATHDVDIVRYLTGSEVQRVYAETAQRAYRSAEDLICASLRLDDGTTGVLEVNWITPAKVRELTVTCEKGMFVVNYVTQDLSFYENPRAVNDWDALGVVRGTGEGDMVRYALERREPLRVEWESLARAVRERAEPPVTGWDGLAALSTARAIQESGVQHVPLEPGYRAAFSSAGRARAAAVARA